MAGPPGAVGCHGCKKTVDWGLQWQKFLTVLEAGNLKWGTAWSGFGERPLPGLYALDPEGASRPCGQAPPRPTSRGCEPGASVGGRGSAGLISLKASLLDL